MYCNERTPMRTPCVPTMPAFIVIYRVSAVILVQSCRYKMTISWIVLCLLLLVPHKHIKNLIVEHSSSAIICFLFSIQELKDFVKNALSSPIEV